MSNFSGRFFQILCPSQNIRTLGIRPSIERERTPIPTGEGERDRRRPEKLVPLCKTSLSLHHY